MNMTSLILSHPGLDEKTREVELAKVVGDEIINSLTASVGKGAKGIFVTFSAMGKKHSAWVSLAETKKGGQFGRASKLTGKRQVKEQPVETANDDKPQTDQPDSI